LSAALLILAGVPGLILADEPPRAAAASVLFVDASLPEDCTSGRYSAARRNCSGSDGRAFRSLQAGVDATRPGDTLRIRAGVYKQGAERTILLVNHSGAPGTPIRIEAFGDGPVELRGRGFEDQDRDGDGRADGPASSGDRSVLVAVTADHVHIRGLDVGLSSYFGLAIQGSENRIEETVVHDSWMSNVTIGTGSRNNVLRYVEARNARHGGGIGLGPRAKDLRELSGNRIERCLSHHNGRLPDGTLVLPIRGDPAGGGNSDGAGTSKTCASATGANLCVNLAFIGTIVWGNADDGFDNSFADSLMQDNIAFDNGPRGNRGFKELRYTSGNTYVGNLALANGAFGFETRSHDGIRLFHNTAARNPARGLEAKINAGEITARSNVAVGNGETDLSFSGSLLAGNWAASSQGDPRFQNAGATIDTRLPPGTVETRYEFLRTQFVAAFSPAPGSPLIDAGTRIEGLHCATADDGPSPPAGGASCRHWRGRAPDLGAFEAPAPQPKNR
jgi:hypothetical protein